jgi:hypothetical protein
MHHHHHGSYRRVAVIRSVVPESCKSRPPGCPPPECVSRASVFSHPPTCNLHANGRIKEASDWHTDYDPLMIMMMMMDDGWYYDSSWDLGSEGEFEGAYCGTVVTCCSQQAEYCHGTMTSDSLGSVL